jgi:hypothetical protein
MLWLQQTAQVALLAVLEGLMVMAECFAAQVQPEMLMLSGRLKMSRVLVGTPRCMPSQGS